MSWIEMARKVEKDYGAFVDWDEEFFVCPECGEPIYAGDWDEEDFGNGHCPVCFEALV